VAATDGGELELVGGAELDGCGDIFCCDWADDGDLWGRLGCEVGNDREFIFIFQRPWYLRNQREENNH
jgi:hypothetical protein